MKILKLAVIALAITSVFGCTNMSSTEQGTLSGSALGAAAGAGIAAIAGGNALTGGIIGGGLGALGGYFTGKKAQ